jgi:hypothetical protein
MRGLKPLLNTDQILFITKGEKGVGRRRLGVRLYIP